MTLLKDLIEIPEQIQKGDYVLRLAEGVNHAEKTVKDYVVPPELEKCFENALSFIRSAVSEQTSKASYLHGSFGSGKSHFMAVLHLILAGNPAARSIKELAGVIARHNEWTEGKRFLLVPYHMIGAANMESGILGGYADFLRKTHPDAPPPAVYLSEGLFRDAQGDRAAYGEEAFFRRLNEGLSGAGGWGELESGWTPERFDAAMAAGPNDEERLQLVSRLLATGYQGYQGVVRGQGEAYVSLDSGLSIISRHARSLGYDVLILFLDELILWLASHAANQTFIAQEVQKLAKLVERQATGDPIPVVSFVARQRDLRELVGEGVPGADQLNFADSLSWQEGRFHRITLEDRNLPMIASKRLLKCKSDAAAKELEASFEAFLRDPRTRESVMNTLLTTEGDRQMFRLIYPFSPALVQTLIALSTMLQRERTALKAMAQLLVDQRETLKLGDIVPVGDLFDVIAHGDEALSPLLAHHFENAKGLYHRKLLPEVERKHGRREELEQLPPDDTRRMAFQNDDRLIKTLLLSALAPDVESLRALTAERLAALNHGTIRTPIPGREAQEVLRRCREWAGRVGELKVTEDANPTITVQLSGVDTESILTKARDERIDNRGNRVRLIRAMLFEMLKIEGEGELEQFHDFPWRNTPRTCQVMLANIRELRDSSLANEDERWKLVIDFPFDEPGYGPRDDISRLTEFRDRHPDGARTILWIPNFLSDEAQGELGTLVILEHVLTGERFGGYANHLSITERSEAKTLLENQRSVLRQRVRSHLEAAYGLTAVLPGSLDASNRLEAAEQFQSLKGGFDLRPPKEGSLAAALEGLLDQALADDFPAHPLFEAEVKRTHLNKVYEQVLRGIESGEERVAIDKPLRPLLRQIAQPLRLGEMGTDATHFLLGQHWRQHFERKIAEHGGEVTVERMRQWIDEPRPMGLPRLAENVVILLFATQTNRSFFLHGGPEEPALADLRDELELRVGTLPAEEDWTAAHQRAAALFGISISPLRKASNVARLVEEVKKKIAEQRPGVSAYHAALKERMERMGLDPDASARARTIAAAVGLAEKLHWAEGEGVIKALVSADIPTSEAAVGECLRHGEALATSLTATAWEIIEAAQRLTDHRRKEAEQIATEVRSALENEEQAVSLAATLRRAQARATRLLAETLPVAQPETLAPPAPPEVKLPEQPAALQVRVIEENSLQGVDFGKAREKWEELKRYAEEGKKVVVSLSWRVEAREE